MTAEQGQTEEQVVSEAQEVLKADEVQEPYEPRTLEEKDAIAKKQENDPAPIENSETVTKKDHDKSLKSMQKRIDKLTAQAKYAEESKAQADNRDENYSKFDGIVDEITNKRENYESRLEDLDYEFSSAHQEENKKKCKDISKERNWILTKMNRLEKDYQDAVDSQKSFEGEEKGQKRLKQWGSKLDQLTDRFEDLQGEDGSLDVGSDLYKEALRLMNEGAQKSKWATFSPTINPRFDNSNGVELAVYEASLNLLRSGKTKTENKKSRESISEKRNKQVLVSGLSNTNPGSDKSLSNRKIDDIMSQAVGDKAGFNTRQALKALKAAGRIPQTR